MNTYTKISFKILVFINLLLIVPGVVGLYASFVIMLESDYHILGAISFVSILVGIANAIYLIRRFHNKKAWSFNLGVSIWAILFWTLSFAVSKEFSWKPIFLLVYIWPLAMSICSIYVLQKLEVREHILV